MKSFWQIRKERFNWLIHNPVALLNVIFVLSISALFLLQLLRPLDVLDNWHVSIESAKEYRIVNVNGNKERVPVYSPGDTLVFVSKSEKLIDAKGTTSRMIVCEPTDTLDTREIQLDNLPAARPSGVNPPRENAIIVPDVAQFNGLPRTCKIVFDIVYENVALWRTHTEHAETDPFIVQERQIDRKAIEQQIKELNEKIKELERRLANTPVNAPTTTSKPQPQMASRHSIVKKPTTSSVVVQTPKEPSETPVQAPQPEVQPKGILRSLSDAIFNLIGGI